MDFRQLETFVEVAKLKSFSKAAEKLFITQPTVTNHIQNLEKELGTLLINRFGKKITLTDAGNLLYKYAINILNSCEMAKFDLASYQGKIQGHLHIYSSSVPRKYLLPTIIKNFLNNYPDVSFTVGDKDSKKVIRGILDGETDFGILGAKFPSNNLRYIDLMEDRLVLVTPNSPDFPGENFSFISKDILFREKIIFREEGSGTRFKRTLCRRPKKYKVFYVEDLDFIRKFYFAFHKNRQLSPLSEAFKNYILEFVKDQKK